MKSVGLIHAGLQDIILPYPRNYLANGDSPIKSVGLIHAGLQGIILPYPRNYLVKGRVLKILHAPISFSGVITVPIHKCMVLIGSIYSPNGKKIFSVNATLTRLFTSLTIMNGKLSQSQSCMYGVNGGLSTLSKCFYGAKGLAFGILNLGYRAKSVLFSNHKRVFKLTAYLHGLCKSFYIARGTKKSFFAALTRVNGSIVDGKKYTLSMMGTINKAEEKILSIRGKINSKNIGLYYTVKGYHAVISYVCRVPIRLQEFITNKRWFK